MLSGIYKFENNENGKIYIGQAQNLGVRYNSHFNNHNNENLKDYNTKFYRALRKYGFHNFTYEILELVDLNNLNAREEYWIEYFNSFNNGYNGNKGGDKVTERGEDHPCSKLSNKEVEEIKDLLKNTNISQYQIADKYKVSQSIISEINTGEKWSSIGSNDYPIRKTKRNKTDTILILPVPPRPLKLTARLLLREVAIIQPEPIANNTQFASPLLVE